jgi:hypothetical protein
MLSYASPGQRYSGGFVATAKSNKNGQKVREYVQRMREITSSVGKRDARIQELKRRARRDKPSTPAPTK